MAIDAGAALSRIDRHYIYIDGLPDPRDPEGMHALTGGNGRSMWVNAQGRRFTNESGWDKRILVDLLNQKPSTYWAVFDETAREGFGVRGAAWLSTPMDGHPILDNPKSAHKAQSLEALAKMAGLPVEALTASVNRFNGLIAAGVDADFGRFRQGDRLPATIAKPPFYAVQFFPMTRKNMGGVSIDMKARVLNRQGQVVPGLYAAGELTGSVGINGSHGMDGMFLGPAIMTGRLAGRGIVQAGSGGTARAVVRPNETTAPNRNLQSDAHRRVPEAACCPAHAMATGTSRWCTRRWSNDATSAARCHSPELPFAPLVTRQQRAAQTELCVNCH